MTSRIFPISWDRLPRLVMTRVVLSIVSEIVFMPWTVVATASSPRRASSEALVEIRSASSAILATSFTAAAISVTRWLALEAALLRVSAFLATPSMDVVICSMVAEVSVTVPARFSRFFAIWSMETVISSMVAEASVTVPARVELDLATSSMDAPISVIDDEVSST